MIGSLQKDSFGRANEASLDKTPIVHVTGNSKFSLFQLSRAHSDLLSNPAIQEFPNSVPFDLSLSLLVHSGNEHMPLDIRAALDLDLVHRLEKEGEKYGVEHGFQQRFQPCRRIFLYASGGRLTLSYWTS